MFLFHKFPRPVRGEGQGEGTLNGYCSVVNDYNLERMAMVSFRKFRQSINFKLLVSVLALSVAVSFITTAIRLQQIYKDYLNDIKEQMEYIKKSYLPSLNNSFWMLDKEQIQLGLEGIIRLPHMQYAAVSASNLKVMASAGSPPSNKAITSQLPMSYVYNGREIDLGTLVLAADMKEVKTVLWRDVYFTFFTEGFKILLLSGFILFLFHMLVTRHLIMMADYARKLHIHKEHNPLVLQRRASKTGRLDEFDEVTAAINGTIDNLSKSYGDLKLINTYLEKEMAERTQAEIELWESEERLADAQKIAHLGNWEFEVANRKLWWSDEIYRIFGLDKNGVDLSPEMVIDHIHPDDRQRFSDEMTSGLKTRSDYRIFLPDGTIRFIHEEIRIEYDSDNRPLRYRGTAQDITELKKIEEELLGSREFIRNILDTVDEGFIVIDRDYRIILANKAYTRQVGLPIDDIIGKRCYEISHHSDRPCYEAGEECAVRQTFENGVSCSYTHQHPDGQGNIIFVETKSFPLKNTSGEVVSAIEIVNNITDRHLLEEQMLRTQKLEAVGILAGGIAHDFNNLLQAVFGNISLAKIFSDRDQKSYEMLERAEHALDLSKNLAKQLLTFSKGGEPVKKVIALTDVIQDAVKFALSGSNVDYSFTLDDDLWQVEADEGQITQVIQNIVLNASEAMPGGGKIKIAARNAVVNGESLVTLEKGKYVLITINDTGMGISESEITKIFDPYFTTKKKGSGLGLATSYAIIKKHHGTIDVRSKLGVGTTFFIYIPVSEEKLSPKEPRENNLVTGKGRILVMDDEEMVRTMVGELIETIGYEVDFAVNGEEAIEKYSKAMKSGSSFDAVLMDLTIRGGMGGKETIKKMLEVDPAVRAIVSSGYSEDPITANYSSYGFKATLSKPYGLYELSRVLLSLMKTEV